jgi:hypothetical protein
VTGNADTDSGEDSERSDRKGERESRNPRLNRSLALVGLEVDREEVDYPSEDVRYGSPTRVLVVQRVTHEQRGRRPNGGKW